MNFDYDKLSASETHSKATHDLGLVYNDERKLNAFAQHYYDLGYKHGDTKWRNVFGHLGSPGDNCGRTPDEAGNAVHTQYDEYESRLATQKTITERLQAQIEAERTKVVKARMIINALLDSEDMITRARAAHFLEDTK